MEDIPYHLHKGPDAPRISYNDLKDKPAASTGAWTFVSYTTAADDEITISGLDLATDLCYHVIVESRHATTASNVLARVKRLHGRGAQVGPEQRLRLRGGPGDLPDSGISGQTSWDMGEGMAIQSIDMKLHHNSRTVLALWQQAGSLPTRTTSAPRTAPGSGTPTTT